jgi:hypothetical protein
VWDVRTARLLATFNTGNQYMLDMDVSRDGTRIVTAGTSPIPRIWDSLAPHERDRVQR